jgi:HD-GYP domain-containing protein (c-di-GMP phosphodiesterase class II)
MHPMIGANMHFACGLGLIGEWVLAHHERPDGRGYPYGLAGTQIPLPAKILAAADAYDAMRTDRVYREALTPDQAASEMRLRAGEQFDEAVVEVLLEIN